MAMKLVFQGTERGQYPLREGSWSIGSTLDADIPLAHEGIEPFHCELMVGAQGVRLRVPPGTKHGTVQRLRGEGPARLGGGSKPPRGDIRYRFVIEVPEPSTDEQRDAVSQFGDLFPAASRERLFRES